MNAAQDSPRVLITGATGFVGRVLCQTLAQAGYRVRAALRAAEPMSEAVAEQQVIGDIVTTRRWEAVLDGVDSVVHLAARTHVLHDSAAHSHLYVATNVEATRRLAAAAAQARVRRFVYLSSVKVNGEGTQDEPYTASDRVQPRDVYAASKWTAEQSLNEMTGKGAMETAIVRPPLVYGPGVRANFLRLMHWVDRERPLPLGAVQNCRSLVNVWNLCDLLVNLLDNRRAVAGTWMVSDGEDLSTPELIRRLGRAMDRSVRLPRVPVKLLNLLGACTGRRAEVARLCGSLVVDISRTCRELEWVPLITVDEGLARTVEWYRREGYAHEN